MRKKKRIVNFEGFLFPYVYLFSFSFYGGMFWLSQLDEQVFPLPLLSF